ncbi:MAG: metal-dependent transcriptional regulator [Clostridia bacterium]|nr:metal-dependent transcriptional regulator [Clostridia bacterium]
MIIKESAENYLESVLMLKKKNGHVRSVDVANDLGFSKASVSVAMKNLREEGYITTDADGGIVLTDKGLAVAERMYERHHVLADLLIRLGVSESVAYEDSCKIEHYLSQESFDKIKEYMKK